MGASRKMDLLYLVNPKSISRDYRDTRADPNKVHDQPCSFIGVKSSHLSLQKSQVAVIFWGDFFTWPPINDRVFPITVIMFIFIFRCSFYGFPKYQWGCCIRSTLAMKLLHIVLLHEDNTQQDLKNSSPMYTCDKNLHQLSAMLVHYFWK